MPIPPDAPVWIPASYTPVTRAAATWTLTMAAGSYTPATRAALVWLPAPPFVPKIGFWGILVADTS
jgi:hypothetical protein